MDLMQIGSLKKWNLYSQYFTIVNLLKNDEIHISPFLSGTNAILQEQFNLINDDNRIRSLRLICERRDNQLSGTN